MGRGNFFAPFSRRIGNVARDLKVFGRPNRYKFFFSLISAITRN